MRQGFTLIELLIVIGIIAVLSTVVILSLQPTELLSQARDGTRLAEIKSLEKATAFAISQNPSIDLGLAKTIYVSIPDTASNCPTVAPLLPQLATGWSYNCVLAANLNRADGSGWAPINFQNLGLSVLEQLPVDPVNSATRSLYYTYTPGYEFDAKMESAKFVSTGSADKESTDGGDNPQLFEAGTKLSSLKLWRPDISLNSFSSGATGAGGPAPSLAFNHTINAGNNRILIVGISGSNCCALFGIQEVRYPDASGPNFTKLVEVYNNSTNYISSIWYLKNPPVGTATVYVRTAISNANMVVGAVTLNDVDPTSPVDISVYATGTSAAASVSLVTTSENDWIFDNLEKVYNAVAPVAGSGQTSYWNSPTGNNAVVGAGSIKIAATPGATSTSWTFPSGAWQYAAAAFRKVQ